MVPDVNITMRSFPSATSFSNWSILIGFNDVMLDILSIFTVKLSVKDIIDSSLIPSSHNISFTLVSFAYILERTKEWRTRTKQMKEEKKEEKEGKRRIFSKTLKAHIMGLKVFTLKSILLRVSACQFTVTGTTPIITDASLKIKS